MISAVGGHWPEYMIEAGLLGAFMASACVCVVCVQHPASPVRARIASGLLRRAIVGILMGATAIGLIYSAWGQRSGAHMNPGVTLSYLALGKIGAWDAVFYVAAQFLGGYSGVVASGLLIGRAVRHESVNFVVTAPGRRGLGAAWAAEFVIAFILMLVVLAMTNRGATAPYAGVGAGVLVSIFITLEAPFSGMSINPARTLASALAARSYRGLWIYFTAPPLAMLCAAGLYSAAVGTVYCAKMSHGDGHRCIFRCEVERMPGSPAIPAAPVGIRHAGAP
jgi:aquaporin Z